MTISQLRQNLKKRINRLPEHRLRSAADFIGYLEESSNPIAATMSRRLAKSEREVARGLVTPASELRRKY
jgi:hypothetical protein